MMKTSNLRGGGDGGGVIELHKLPHLSHQLVQDNEDNINVYSDKKLMKYPNPLENNPFFRPSEGFFVSDSDIVLHHTVFDLKNQHQVHDDLFLHAYRRAGPRKDIFFDTSKSCVRAAIVTCGGLCPGMNTVIRELVVGLWDLYGVRNIYGVRAGFRGFYSHLANISGVGVGDPIPLEPKVVHNWHMRGGTVLETSRGGFDLQKIVDAIQHQGFNQVYIIGGDGTMRGAVKIFDEISRRKLEVAVVGIPKTVDNDVGIIDRSFGFQTAVEMAQQSVHAAHVEAESAVNGIGLVKLMGRSTGHIALHATLSSRDVDCCLIPENDFYLEGKQGLGMDIGNPNGIF